MSIITSIITHRGLDFSKTKYYPESTLESFKEQLKKGYGLEFDIRITKDDKFIIWHDKDLSRLTNGKNNSKIDKINLKDLLNIKINKYHLVDLSSLLKLIKIKSKANTMSALHLKADLQNKKILDLLIKELKDKNLDNIVIFDVKKETAIYLKKEIPKIKLIPSVAHEYDIKRYNKYTGDTLWKLNDVFKNKKLFYGVWLDEWDTKDKNNKNKTLYKKEVFDKCRSENLKIFIVSPELHATSPVLLAKESHSDAKDINKLQLRLKKILKLRPDGICTDYSNMIKKMI